MHLQLGVIFAFAIAAAVPAAATEQNAATIARAMSAGPTTISARAKIIDMDSKGKVIVLRNGTNGFTCYAGHKNVPTDDPFCADTPGMQWIADWMAHKQRPTNAVPGVVYMLQGAEDWSATNPWATKGTLIHEAPHYMIMWPFRPRDGFTTAFKNAGTWLMWAGTPYAHLMVQGKP